MADKKFSVLLFIASAAIGAVLGALFGVLTRAVFFIMLGIDLPVWVVYGSIFLFVAFFVSLDWIAKGSRE